MVAREKGEIWTLCLPNTGLQQGTYSKSLNPLNAKLNPICHLLALLGAHRILHFSRVGVNPMRIVHIQTQSYSTNTTNYVQDNWKCCGASAQNASTNGRQSRGGHVRCTCTVFFARKLLHCHDVLGSVLIQMGFTTMPVNVWCSNGGQQPYILPSVIRLVPPQAGEAKNEQNPNGNVNEGSNEAPVLSPGNNVLRKYTTYSIDVDDRLSGCVPNTSNHDSHKTLHSASSCVWLFFQPAVRYLRSPKPIRGGRDNFTTRSNPDILPLLAVICGGMFFHGNSGYANAPQC